MKILISFSYSEPVRAWKSANSLGGTPNFFSTSPAPVITYSELHIYQILYKERASNALAWMSTLLLGCIKCTPVPSNCAMSLSGLTKTTFRFFSSRAHFAIVAFNIDIQMRLSCCYYWMVQSVSIDLFDYLLVHHLPRIHSFGYTYTQGIVV